MNHPLATIDFEDERLRAVCLAIQAVKLAPGREAVETVNPETGGKMLECYRYVEDARLFIAVADAMAPFSNR